MPREISQKLPTTNVDESAHAKQVDPLSARALGRSPALLAAVRQIVSERLPSFEILGINDVLLDSRNGKDFSYSYPKVRKVIQQGDQVFSATPEHSTKFEVGVDVKNPQGIDDGIFLSLLIDNGTRRVLASHVRDLAEVSLVRQTDDLTV